MLGKPIADVVVPQFDGSHLTLDLIASLRRSNAPVRIVLVDDGSAAWHRDRARQAVEHCGLPHRFVALERNAGFVKAVNAGLAKTDAPLVVVQNNDTLVYDGCYERMSACFEQSGDVGIVGPVTDKGGCTQELSALKRIAPVFRARTAGVDFGTLPHEKRAQALRELLDGHRLSVNRYLAFFCAMMSRKALDKLGGLDESFGVGFGDDNDMCQRARDHGFGLVVALDVYVHHAHRSTFRAKYSHSQIGKMQAKAKAVYIQRHGRPPS